MRSVVANFLTPSLPISEGELPVQTTSCLECILCRADSELLLNGLTTSMNESMKVGITYTYVLMVYLELNSRFSSSV